MTRVLVLFAAAITTFAVAATAAPAATTPPNLKLAMTLDARDEFGGCCTDSVDATSTRAFPRIGHATLSAQFFLCPRSYYCGSPTGFNSLRLTFVTPAGTLALVGDGDDTGTGAWTVDASSSTGRFARATGSGTYAAAFTWNGSYEYPYLFGTLTVELSGNLSFAPAR